MVLSIVNKSQGFKVKKCSLEILMSIWPGYHG